MINFQHQIDSNLTGPRQNEGDRFPFQKVERNFLGKNFDEISCAKVVSCAKFHMWSGKLVRKLEKVKDQLFEGANGDERSKQREDQ